MILCLACGATNPLDNTFCSQCGARLLIQERYRALRIIGQGGFGKTFLAEDKGKPSLPKCVIKQFIYEDAATLAEAQRLFQQEAVRLDDLGKHNQIPELLAHCEHERRQYLVQEFIDGENLLQELNRAGRFSEAKIKDLLLDLLPVLQFIHKGQVIHRDIKPENIIRRRSDQKLVLVDFGAAKMASKTALAKTGTTIGSAEYTAPEQARGKAVFASDIYALGVTCIYLLTQISPFDLFSDHEDAWVWRQFLNGNSVSNDLGLVIDRMLAKALGIRYQTATEILQTFQPVSPDPTKFQPAPSARVVIPQASSRVPQAQALEFQFEYVKTRLVTESGGFLGLGTKKTVALDRKQGKAQYIRENLGNGVTMDLIRIPAGKFKMGSNEYGDEQPIHEVTISEFWIGKYAVTNAQWEAVMGTRPWERSDVKFHNKNQPVINVSWDNSSEFCEKLSQKIGKKTKLPSEAQWEYACRAGTTTAFHFGDIVTPDLVNYDGNHPYGEAPKGEYRQKTVNVESFTPNAYGLYQMHGNVWEWCEDKWHDNYNNAPTDGSAWLAGGEQNKRALRGGSWNYLAFYCRSAYRHRLSADSSSNNISFRVVFA